jgi:hypothetical protein
MSLLFVKLLYFMYSCLLRTGVILCRIVCVFGLFACLSRMSRLLCLACYVCLIKIEIFVLIFAEFVVVFLIVKFDGYLIPGRNLMGTGMCTNLYS